MCPSGMFSVQVLTVGQLLLIGQMSSAVNILSNLSCATLHLLILSHCKDRSATSHRIQAFELLAKY